MGSATNYGLNSTLKAVKSHGTDAPCPEKFAWLLKFDRCKHRVNFGLGGSLLAAALRQAHEAAATTTKVSQLSFCFFGTVGAAHGKYSADKSSCFLFVV